MYRNERSRLLFPRLLFLKNTDFKSWSSEEEHENYGTRVYTMDWSALDKKALRDKGGRLFPDDYLGWLNLFQFAIPYHYRREIRRCVKMAVLEKERNLPFDTAIRDMCGGISREFIKVAFKLLADCAYNGETDYFYRKDDRLVLTYALLYRFWDGQTGRGLPWSFSGLSRYVGDESREGHSAMLRFINAVKKASKEHEKNFPWESVEVTEATEPPTAINVQQWIRNPRYLGKKLNVFPAAKKIMVETFQEHCPNCKTDLEDSMILLEDGKCPVCGKYDYQLFKHPIFEVVGVRGQRSGNSFLVAVAATYQLHKVLMAKLLLAYWYDLPSTTVFEMTFVDPGKHTWNIFWNLVENSRWFKEVMSDESYGFERVGDDEAIFKTRNLRIRRTDLNDSCRGGTRIFATIDSPDWVEGYGTEESLSIGQIYKALKNSLTTLQEKRKRKPDKERNGTAPLMFLMGSPSEKGFLASLQRVDLNFRWYHQPTWEVNPEFSEKQLREEIRDDVVFRRDFAAEFVK